MDSENRNLLKTEAQTKAQFPMNDAAAYGTPGYQYTIADVPRLAEYSASLYASTALEQEQYLKYYTQYYIAQISKVS